MFFFVFIVISITVNAGELIKFEAFDSRQKQPSTVLAEVFIPSNSLGKIPVIITQHGSTRSESFENGPGYTDIFSKELVKQGLKEGYAVVTIDAFYDKGLSPNSKNKFPNATPWGYRLKKILLDDPRFDANRFFYTGYSYGADTVTDSILPRFANQHQWRAIASAEGSCGVQPAARLLPYPVLFIKTAESHYPPAPCIYFSDKLKEAGTITEFFIIPKANHSFSTYGLGGIRSGGIASNGCTDNPVIKGPAGFIHADGTQLRKGNAFDECVTNTSGGGGHPDKLSLAVSLIITFFNKNK